MTGPICVVGEDVGVILVVEVSSSSLEEHLDHLRAVFIALRNARLFGNLGSAPFAPTEYRFLAMLLQRRAFKLIKPRSRRLRVGCSPKRSHK